MERLTIGHGTWYDKMAMSIIERERALRRGLDLIRAEMGIGASGLPHIGSFADGARAYAVTLALKEQGYRSELIAFSDDKDGLRKVPIGFPSWLEEYVGRPVTDIPDPFKCHGSYGDHMSYLLMEALDACGIEYTFVSGSEAYKKGLLNAEIEALLSNAKRVGEIVKEEVGQDKYVKVLPYFPICANCSRIYTTKAYEFLPKEGKVLYACEGMEVKGRLLKGCGYEGEADYRRGEGKLSWKCEFAARWRALDIRFEAYGKDIADSVRINDRICQEILECPPPLHAKYEMFLDKSGRKLSKSFGRVLTPQVWIRYGSPQSLMLLVLKRFVGTRTVSTEDVPRYMDELDNLEDVYFGRRIIEDEKERAKLIGLYKYCWLLKPPERPSVHVPYDLLTYLVRVAPEGGEEDYIIRKLKEYGYVSYEALEELKRRIHYALNWIKDHPKVEAKAVRLSQLEAEAISELIQTLRMEEDADRIQSAIFNLARKHGLHPRDFFRSLYVILLGVPQGPRLGPYIVALGHDNVIKALEEALKKAGFKGE